MSPCPSASLNLAEGVTKWLHLSRLPEIGRCQEVQAVPSTGQHRLQIHFWRFNANIVHRVFSANFMFSSHSVYSIFTRFGFRGTLMPCTLHAEDTHSPNLLALLFCPTSSAPYICPVLTRSEL